jgi:hypothetical protein
MKIVPGDALLHTVQGAAGRTRHAALPPQPPYPSQPGGQSGAVRAEPAAQTPARPIPPHHVERPIPSQPDRPAQRGSAVDITI